MKLFEVRCSCPSKENNKSTKYLGDIRADIAVVGKYHCQNCRETYDIISDGSGRIYRRTVPRAQLIAVHCKSCEERFHKSAFLGNFQRDVVNQGRFHCKNCNKTFLVKANEYGEVSTDESIGVITYSDNLTVIGD
jgi:transposase-like protein